MRPGPTEDEILLGTAAEPERTDEFRKSDPWRVLRIMGEFVDGFERLGDIKDAVTFLGSARTPADHPHYLAATETARLLAKAGFPIVTGGGPGIMEAATKGGDCRSASTSSFRSSRAPTPGFSGACSSASFSCGR
jgi:hypothetical protein